MRVLHLVPALFSLSQREGVVGGAERYVLELARVMAEFVPTQLVSFGSRSFKQRLGKLKVDVIGQPWRVRGQMTNLIAAALIVLPQSNLEERSVRVSIA